MARWRAHGAGARAAAAGRRACGARALTRLHGHAPSQGQRCPHGEVPPRERCPMKRCAMERCALERRALERRPRERCASWRGQAGSVGARLEGPGWAASWLAAGLAASHRSMGPPAHYSLLTTRHAPLTAYPALRTPHYSPLPLTRHQVPRIPRPALRRRGRLVARGGALLAQDGRGADGAAAQRLGQ